MMFKSAQIQRNALLDVNRRYESDTYAKPAFAFNKLDKSEIGDDMKTELTIM